MAFQKIYTPTGRRARIAQLMSGSGTNVIEVLKQELKMGENCPYRTVMVMTDDKRSNARKIASEYGVPPTEMDIRDFQEKMHLGRRLTLATESHRRARDEYSERLGKVLSAYQVDFCVFGGFEPLTNIARYFPCLNVHPGDLTYMKDGKRHLVGLHTAPIQRAIDENVGYVRSCVILAMPYTGAGGNMDDGPILGLGPKLSYEDERDAKKIQNALKEASDWKILPAVVLAAAKGEIEVDYKSNQARGIIVMDLERRMSESRR